MRTELYAKSILNNQYKNIDYLTYTASTDGKYHYSKKNHKIEVPCDDSLYGTYEKTYKTLQLIKQLNIEYDFIFRTNCSTYVNIKSLELFVNNIADPNFIYSGNIICSQNATGPYEWSFYGLGNSLLLSKHWVNILIDNHISNYIIDDNKNKEYYQIDDNTIGMVANCYCITHNIDMYDIWKSFKIPATNTIPNNPNNYIAIPFREYNKNNDRTHEVNAAIYIHNKIISHTDNIDINTFLDNTVHIINFDKGMRTIVTREFADKFVSVMSIYKYNKNKITSK